MLASRGDAADLGQLRERQRALRAEIRALSQAIRQRRKNPPPSVVPDDPVLASLRDSILAMSRNLAIPVDLD